MKWKLQFRVRVYPWQASKAPRLKHHLLANVDYRQCFRLGPCRVHTALKELGPRPVFACRGSV